MERKLNTPAFGPLQGVRVVFSATEVSGPFAAQMLAEWGAEVIWIEHVAYGDTLRTQEKYIELARRNLHALSLNIFSDEGKEAFLKLMETTDILIEASKGPAFARRGVTDELLWEHNPKLVIAHLSGFGQYGDDEYTNLAAYNSIAQAFSGYLVQNGDVDNPTPAFPYTADYLSGYALAGSALAALFNAQRTGVGESIDVAMYEILLHSGQYYMMNYLNGGDICPRQDKGKDPKWGGCGVYACKDGHIVMEIVGAGKLKAMMEKIGLGGIYGTEEMPEGTDLISKSIPSAALIEQKLDEYIGARTVEEYLAELAELKLAGAKILTFPDLESNPQYIARESFSEWKTMAGDTVKGASIAPKFKKQPCKIWRAAPNHGQDTAAILSELGYSDEQIQELADKGLAKLADA